MQLKRLVTALAPIRVEGPLDREVAGIAYDSRRVTPGMVFVAVPGRKADGHDFISTAIDRGAVAVICEKNGFVSQRSEEHTSELQSQFHLVCRLLLEKKKKKTITDHHMNQLIGEGTVGEQLVDDDHLRDDTKL